MARLVNPDSGTVVGVEGDLEAHYRALGWADADAPARSTVAAAPEKSDAPRRGRPRKPE
jgi:hypothetical protein